MSLPPPSERGSALIGVLLLLMVMSALTAAFAVSGQTETLVVRNHQTAAQARAAAESGLNHASQVTFAWLALWPNTYASVDAALDALLADPTLLEPALEAGVRIDVPGTTDAEYEVFIVDEDDASRAGGANSLTADADASNNENGNGEDDANRSLVIRAVGYGPNGSRAELEGIVAPYQLPVIITDGDLTVSGNPTVNAGAPGGIHSNSNLTMTGSAAVIGVPLSNGTATASGTFSGTISVIATGGTEGGVATKRIPQVRASSYRPWADFILGAGGVITNSSGVVVCTASNPNDCRDTHGWRFSSGTWELENDLADDTTVYAETPVKIAGSPGTSILDPVNITIIAEGSIEISGSPVLAPDNAELLFVTDGDLKLSGNLQVEVAEGQMLVREQLQISGNPVLLGQIIVENASNDDTTVTENRISGNPVISYNGDVGTSLFHVSGWRDVR